MDEDKELSVKEVAKQLKMSEKTVYKLIEEGMIPAKKDGADWALDKEELNEWLSSKIAELPAEELEHLEKDHEETVIKITPLIREENIIFNFIATNKNQALKKLVDKVVDSGRISGDQGKNLLKAVISRERMCSTAISEGVAIPHPRYSVNTRLKDPILVIGICKGGMDFESIDGNPTKLLFLISAPRDDIHLKLMARLSRILKDKLFRFNLINAENFEQLKEAVKKREENVDDKK